MDSGADDGHETFEHLQISPLWRGPSGNPRFLVVKHFSSCMAGMTIDYTVHGYGWHPGAPSLTEILKKQSAFSEDGPKWKFDTSGRIIRVPYCWSGPLVLGSVSAPICSVDTYDLSGNIARFARTEDDPADLALISRVVEYAQRHIFEALNPLCTSPQVAREIMAVIPPNLYFAGFSRKVAGNHAEVLDFQDEWVMKVRLKRQNGRWRVAALALQRNY